MSFFSTMNVNASGLTMQRLRMDIISQNIANVETTKTSEGTPYRRKTLLIEEQKEPFQSFLQKAQGEYSIGQGVKVSKIVEDQSPFRKVYNPGHPEADEQGYVSMPNVNIIEEMVNLLSANRAYEANVVSLNTSKTIAMKALEIGK